MSDDKPSVSAAPTPETDRAIGEHVKVHTFAIAVGCPVTGWVKYDDVVEVFAKMGEIERERNEARACALEDVIARFKAIGFLGTEALKELATLPSGYCVVEIDLLDALSSEEGAEQNDINKARTIVLAAGRKLP